MSIDDRNAEFSASYSGGASRQTREEDKTLEALRRQALQAALENGSAALEFFRALPAAVIASERVEHERVVRQYGKDNPRALAMEAWLDRLERMEGQAARGRARAARALEMMQRFELAFHGFVSDTTGEPLPGMTVRLASPRLHVERQARTAPDGYFRIVLPEAAKAPSKKDPELAEVDIIDAQGNRVHEDLLPLQLRAGSAYREYVLDPRGVVPEKRAKRAAEDRSRRRKPFKR